MQSPSATKSQTNGTNKPTREDVSQYFEQQHKNILPLLEAALHECILQSIAHQNTSQSESEINYKALNYFVNYIKSKTAVKTNSKSASQKMKEIQETEVKQQLEKNELMRKEIKNLKSKYEDSKIKMEEIQANQPLELDKIRKHQQEQKEELHNEIILKQKQVEELVQRNSDLKAAKDKEKQDLEIKIQQVKQNITNILMKWKHDYEKVLSKEVFDQIIDISALEPSAAKQQYLLLFSLLEKQKQQEEEQNDELRMQIEKQKEQIQQMQQALEDKKKLLEQKQLEEQRVSEPSFVTVSSDAIIEQQEPQEPIPISIETVTEQEHKPQLEQNSLHINTNSEISQNLSFVDDSFNNEEGDSPLIKEQEEQREEE